jgi:hypothetical protein
MELLPAYASNPIRIFSFGGGVQSTAVMVLQATGQLCTSYDYFIFSNVGEDSESPATLAYIEQYTKPYAREHGIQFVEVQKLYKGKPDTLLSSIIRNKRSVPIPARMSNGAPGNRSCTNDFKIRVVDRWIKQHGYTHATVGLGISLDEFTRMRGEQWHDVENGQPPVKRPSSIQMLLPIFKPVPIKPPKPRKLGFWKRRQHPLIDMRINRLKCAEIILNAGLPIPPKSSCYFCPFMKRRERLEQRENEPILFFRTVLVEKLINKKRDAMGRDYVCIHPDNIPILEATKAPAESLDLVWELEEMETCVEVCMT